MLSSIRDIEALSLALAPALALASTPLNLDALALDGPPFGLGRPSRDEGLYAQGIEMQDSDAGLSRPTGHGSVITTGGHARDIEMQESDAPMVPNGHGSAITTGGVECTRKRQRQQTSSKSIPTQLLKHPECLKF